MIRCIPRGICSWNFILEGAGHRASLEMNLLGEQGTIIADEISYEVHKHGVFRGQWTLDDAGVSVAAAEKVSALKRMFEIHGPDGLLVLRAVSALGRSYRLDRSGEMFGTIIPDHAFTRRATIEIYADEWDFPTVAFAFWLAVLTWRRAANSSS